MRAVVKDTLPIQVARHLREGIQKARWGDSFPGVPQLASELDVGRNTVRRALKILEHEGVLSDRGQGRSRAIVGGAVAAASQRPLRVNVLRHDVHLTDNPQTSIVLTEIMHELEAAGHEVFCCRKTQMELHHDVAKLSRQLSKEPADAWVVESGRHALLKWCAAQATPCLALYGRTDGLEMARTGPDLVQAYREGTRHLIARGHRRIVMIVRSGFRLPTPGVCETGFLEELRAHQIPTSVYNLPNWEETPKGFNRLLERLFQSSPPTAILIDEMCWLIAALAFFAHKGIRVPEQVSLVSGDAETSLDQCHPSFAHIRWDNRLIARRVVRWVDAVRKGKADRKVMNIPAEFVNGGSIASV